MELKKQEAGFRGALLAPLVDSLVQSIISFVVKSIGGRGSRRAGGGYVKVMSILLSISITNLGLMEFFQKTVYLE